MGAGKGVAKGEGVKGAVLRGALGAGTGALTAGATGALSKGAEEAATKTIEKEAMDASMDEILKQGLDKEMMPIVTDQAMNMAAVGAKVGEESGKAQALNKFADLTKKAQGNKDTQKLLGTIGKGSKSVGAVAQAFEPPETPKFAQIATVQPRRRQHPGFTSAYQYDPQSYGVRTVDFGRYYG
jgi:hypothetical protein